jgi:hypothetical protein
VCPAAFLFFNNFSWLVIIEYLPEEMRFTMKKYPSFPLLNPEPGMDHHAYMVVRKRKEHG